MSIRSIVCAAVLLTLPAFAVAEPSAPTSNPSPMRCEKAKTAKVEPSARIVVVKGTPKLDAGGLTDQQLVTVLGDKSPASGSLFVKDGTSLVWHVWVEETGTSYKVKVGFGDPFVPGTEQAVEMKTGQTVTVQSPFQRRFTVDVTLVSVAAANSSAQTAAPMVNPQCSCNCNPELGGCCVKSDFCGCVCCGNGHCPGS